MAEGLGELNGTVLGGRYRLGDKLGQGGMGAVYHAVQTSLGRQVAIKVLLPILSNDGSLVARFKSEAEQAGRLNHPHIVQVIDFGIEESGSVWIAMELLEGEPLGARIERGPLSEAEAVQVGKETLAGLEAAHGARLVHRDLKPDNIFLSKAAGIGVRVKILDFGIAKLLDGDSASKLTATGLVIGTPLYMSPEQARGEDLDPRSDLYSLGAVLYETLTGQPPFTGRNYNALLVAVLTQEAQPITELRPDLTPEFAALVMRALSKDKNARFSSAAEMTAALSSFTPKTEVPPSGAELGLASTMATPQAQPVPAGMGNATPTRPQNPSEAAAMAGGSAPTPVAGGIGPGPGPSPAGLAAANAVTDPMTEVPARGAGPQPKRRHGWLVPAMVGVALLAGIGGTAAFMSAGQSAEPMAMADTDTSGAAAELAPVVVAGGQPPAVAPVQAAPPGVPAMEPNAGEPAPAEVAGDEPSGGEDTEVAEARAEPAATAMRRRPTVRHDIRFSGGGYFRNWDRSVLPRYANWSECWPPGLPFPESNTGLSLNATINTDGVITAAGPRGNNLYPPISACLAQKVIGASVGTPPEGDDLQINISFSFYESASMRRR